MNNVVDRVPTQVLSNGAIRWEQFDSSGNSLGYVYLKRADEPTVEGTAINKVLFDSIGSDLTNLNNNKLNVSAKATQVQAETGTDNTNYMTALRVKQAMNVSKVIYNGINLSSSSDNEINLSTYINSNVVKLEIPINIKFKSEYTSIKLAGTGIEKNRAGIRTGTTSEKIANQSYIASANLNIIIYPNQNKVDVFGTIYYSSSSSTGNQTEEKVSDVYTYETLTKLNLGKIDSTFYNYDKPTSIIQYLK